ncbi:hypothetical protein [Xanthobacter sp. KR7-225]|uniref:hypothetical protein n=1 Tax=Xanthobacter sp. KR7-225 TaxID=3156613 RepID=UPI0032B5E7A1
MASHIPQSVREEALPIDNITPERGKTTGGTFGAGAHRHLVLLPRRPAGAGGANKA